MISVALGAAIALVGALAVIAIDWERIRARITRRRSSRIARENTMRAVERHIDRLPLTGDWPTVCAGDGFKVVADDSLDVTSKRYANGSVQVWLRRAS